jgi:hypothetical protein
MVELVAVAGKVALVRAVPLVTEAVTVQLTATVLKVRQAEEEVARVLVKAKAAPGNNRYK